jgi:hypothetical protein
LVDGIEESQRLAQLQETITNWMMKQGTSVTADADDDEQRHIAPEPFSMRHVCSDELALNLTSELLGDYCTDEDDASNRFDIPVHQQLFLHIAHTLPRPSLPPAIFSMCFVVQWQMHVSRAFLRQDGRCVNMPPLASESDAQLLRSIILGPTPTAVESRSDPTALFGKPTIQCFKRCEAGQWLVADADNSKAIKVCGMGGLWSFLSVQLLHQLELAWLLCTIHTYVRLQFSVECNSPNVDTIVFGSSTCLLEHLQTLQVLICLYMYPRGCVSMTHLCARDLLQSVREATPSRHFSCR